MPNCPKNISGHQGGVCCCAKRAVANHIFPMQPRHSGRHCFTKAKLSLSASPGVEWGGPTSLYMSTTGCLKLNLALSDLHTITWPNRGWATARTQGACLLHHSQPTRKYDLPHHFACCLVSISCNNWNNEGYGQYFMHSLIFSISFKNASEILGSCGNLFHNTYWSSP